MEVRNGLELEEIRSFDPQSFLKPNQLGIMFGGLEYCGAHDSTEATIGTTASHGEDRLPKVGQKVVGAMGSVGDLGDKIGRASCRERVCQYV